MTISQLLETVLGKACCFEGTFGDATPFSSNSTDVAESICNRLKVHGFERYGNEQLTNGMTGEIIDAQVFFGPVYYQRLKHMVSDKMHSRSQGHVTTLTRQPLEGRSIGLCCKKLQQVYNTVGDIFKLREHLVKSLILTCARNSIRIFS